MNLGAICFLEVNHFRFSACFFLCSGQFVKKIVWIWLPNKMVALVAQTLYFTSIWLHLRDPKGSHGQKPESITSHNGFFLNFFFSLNLLENASYNFLLTLNTHRTQSRSTTCILKKIWEQIQLRTSLDGRVSSQIFYEL